MRVPAMNAFIRPRTHARYDQQVDALRVGGRLLFDELQCAVHAARFIAMHAARDEYHRSLVAPAATRDREQSIVIGRIVELSVLGDVEPSREPLDDAHNVTRGTAMAGLAREAV